MTAIDERDLVRVRGIIADLVLDYHGSKRASEEAYQIVEPFLRRSTAYTGSKLTLPMLEGICRDAANLYPPRVSRPTNAAVRAKGVVSLPLAFDLKGNCRTGRNTLAVLSFRGPLRRFVSVRSV